MTTFFDTNTLIAALNDKEPHHLWSKKQLETADRPIVIVDIVYAEFSVSMNSVQEVNDTVAELSMERHSGGSDAALFLAAKAYLKYKKQNKGRKLSLLPDFLIGAAADVEGATLVTANPRDYVRYFPNIKLELPPAIAKPAATVKGGGLKNSKSESKP